MSKHHHSEVGPHNQFDQSIHQKLIKGLTKMNEYVHRISHNYRIGRWFVTFFMMMIVILSSKQCSFTKDHKSIMISIHIPYSVCCVFPPPLKTWKKAKGKNLNKTWMMIMMMMMIQLFMFVINSLKNVYWMEK